MVAAEGKRAPAGPTLDRVLASQVAADVYEVGMILRSLREPTADGPILWYEDDRLVVRLDQRITGVWGAPGRPPAQDEVRLRDGRTVYRKSVAEGVTILRPGHWLGYLHSLALRARAVRGAQAAEALAEEERAAAERYGWIDDAAVFAGVRPGVKL